MALEAAFDQEIVPAADAAVQGKLGADPGSLGKGSRAVCRFRRVRAFVFEHGVIIEGPPSLCQFGFLYARPRLRGCARVEVAAAMRIGLRRRRCAASASAFRARVNPFTRRVRAPASPIHSDSETVRENSVFFFLLIWSFPPSGKPICPFRLRRSLFDVAELRPHKLHPCRNGHLGLGLALLSSAFGFGSVPARPSDGLLRDPPCAPRMPPCGRPKGSGLTQSEW
jgi:hypothetical protein